MQAAQQRIVWCWRGPCCAAYGDCMVEVSRALVGSLQTVQQLRSEVLLKAGPGVGTNVFGAIFQFLGGEHDDLDAGFFQLLAVHLVFAFGHEEGLLAFVGESGLNDLAVCLGNTFELLLVHDVLGGLEVHVVLVVVLDDVAETEVVQVRRTTDPTLDDAGLQGGVGVGVGQGRGAETELFSAVLEDVQTGNTDHHALFGTGLSVAFQGVDRAGTDETFTEVGEELDAQLVVHLDHFHGQEGIGSEYFANLVVVAGNVRQEACAETGVELVGNGDVGGVNGAADDFLVNLGSVAKLVGRENFDLDAAFGFLLDTSLDALCGLMGHVLDGMLGSQFDSHGFVLGFFAAIAVAGSKAEHGDQGKHECENILHDVLR